MKGIELGVTGSRHGGTDVQLEVVRGMVLGFTIGDERHGMNVEKLRHGMCVGVDEQMHHLVRELFPDCIIKGHPPIKQHLMARVECDEYAEPKDFIARDKDIVNESQLLIALPNTMHEVLRSGTWTTIRHARKIKRECYIVFPNGNISYDNYAQLKFL